jgi:hypothetical protein
LSPSGNQPFEYKNYVLICNGEIYNYKELIRDYNLNVTSGSDCEVILHLYHLFGSKCLTKLDGEFSFIIYDRIEHFFFIAGVLLVPPREFETNLAVSIPPNIGIDNRPKTYQSL